MSGPRLSAGKTDRRFDRAALAVECRGRADGRTGFRKGSTRSLAKPTHVQELSTQRRIFVVLTTPERSSGQWFGFADPAHLSTQVVGFEIDRDAMWLEHHVQSIGDLTPETLLNGKPLGEKPHQPRQLGNADKMLVGNVADVSVSVKGKGVVLAQGVKLDRPLDDLAEPAIRATLTLGVEHLEQFGIAFIALGHVVQGPNK